MLQQELKHKECENRVKEAQLRKVKAQHEQDQKDYEKTLHDTIKQGEVTIENMRKQNDCKMKELITLQEAFERNNVSWMQKEKEKKQNYH